MELVTHSIQRKPYWVKTRIIFGTGTLRQLPEAVLSILNKGTGKRLLVITGTRTEKKPWQKCARELLRHFDCTWLPKGPGNPTLDSVDEALRVARKAEIDLIIALGGGSVIDTGKVVGLLCRTEQSVRHALACSEPARSRDDIVPVIAVSSTTGTGAEVTPTATVWDYANKAKCSLSDTKLYPVVAIVDPTIATTQPRGVVASCGFDALSQAIEGVWSTRSNSLSIHYGLLAVSLVYGSLLDSCRDPMDLAAMKRLSLGSLYAGLCIAKSQTTLSHAISYPFTVRYGVPHGQACGLSLAEVFAFNLRIADFDCVDIRGKDHVRAQMADIAKAIKAQTISSVPRMIQRLFRRVGLDNLKVTSSFDLDLILQDVFNAERLRNNPRKITERQALRILRSMIKDVRIQRVIEKGGF